MCVCRCPLWHEMSDSGRCHSAGAEAKEKVNDEGKRNGKAKPDAETKATAKAKANATAQPRQRQR